MSDLEVYLDFIRTERLEIVEDLEQIYIQLQSFISRNNSTRNQDYLANLFDLISKYIEAEKNTDNLMHHFDRNEEEIEKMILDTKVSVS